MGIILKPFAWLLLFFYNFLHSYGLALILFAIVVKTLLFPVTLKSKKSMIQTSMISGKMQQLQKQYGKDRERYSMEVEKLYEREKINPMSGCLWSLIPMIVLMALYVVIRQPMTYFMDLTTQQIDQIAVALNWQDVAVANGWVSAKVMADTLAKIAENPAISLIKSGPYNQLYLVSLINEDNLAMLKELVGGGDKMFVMNTQFLGINLAMIPKWKLWQGPLNWNSIGLFLLPIVSVCSSFISMKVSLATNAMNQDNKNNQMDASNKVMMWMMPLMSLWIGFTVPAGLSVYWIAQYLIQMVQEVISGKMLKKDYEAAKQAAEENRRREKEEEKARKEQLRLERAKRAEEAKKNHGKKTHKDVEPDQVGVNKADSREGLRAYARGRAYIPARFGEVTAYVDPTEMAKKIDDENGGKKKKKKKDQAEEKPAEVKETGKKETPAAVEAPKKPEEKKTETPAKAAAEAPAEKAEDENKEV